MSYDFTESESDSVALLASLHKNNSLAISIQGDKKFIALAPNIESGIVIPFTTKVIDFLTAYSGKLIFWNALESLLKLNIKELNNIDDVSFLVKLSEPQDESPPVLDMPMQPLSGLLENTIKLWYLVSIYLKPAQDNKQITIYTNIFQPAIKIRYKMSLLKLDRDKVEYSKICHEIDDLSTWFHRRNPVIKYGEVHPLNKNEIKKFLHQLGYPTYNNISELLWTGDFEEIIQCIFLIESLSKKNTFLLPAGYDWQSISISSVHFNKKELIQQAAELGYMEGAYWMRFYTPLAKKSIPGSSFTPPSVEEECNQTLQKVLKSVSLIENDILIKNTNLVPVSIGDTEILFLKEKE